MLRRHKIASTANLSCQGTQQPQQQTKAAAARNIQWSKPIRCHSTQQHLTQTNAPKALNSLNSQLNLPQHYSHSIYLKPKLPRHSTASSTNPSCHGTQQIHQHTIAANSYDSFPSEQQSTALHTRASMWNILNYEVKENYCQCCAMLLWFLSPWGGGRHGKIKMLGGALSIVNSSNFYWIKFRKEKEATSTWMQSISPEFLICV